MTAPSGSPHRLFNDHRTGFPFKVPAPIYTTLTGAYLAEPFPSGLFLSLLCNLNICKCEGGGGHIKISSWSSTWKCSWQDISSPWFLCGWHDWDMWQSNWLQSTIICVLEPSGSSHHSWVSACPWAMYGGPCMGPLFMTVKHLLFPVPLRSPRQDFDKCASEANRSVLIKWHQRLLSH